MPPAENPIAPILRKQNFLVLDGGLATALEARGLDLNDKLWSARMLLENPDAIRKVHLDYLQAGADCTTTASYQATLPGFRECGYTDDDARKALRLSVELASDARDEFWSDPINHESRQRPLVAASIGPYGAYLADGSEYSGDYGLSEDQLVDFHRGRWEILANCKPDLMACETIPSRIEASALLRLASELPSPPAWISFSCRDGSHLWDGTPIAHVAAECEEVDGIAAIGVNCTAPGHISSLIQAIRSQTSKPVFVYPNSGEKYNAVSKTWQEGVESFDWDEAITQWVALGARGIGGCCRIGPEAITRLRGNLGKNQ